MFFRIFSAEENEKEENSTDNKALDIYSPTEEMQF